MDTYEVTISYLAPATKVLIISADNDEDAIEEANMKFYDENYDAYRYETPTVISAVKVK